MAGRSELFECGPGGRRDVVRIAGSPVVFSFKWPHTGWECDEDAWITDEGKAWGTNHGSPCQLSLNDLEEQREQIRDWLAGTDAAIAIIDEKSHERD